ncbi:hypothetical protein [Priestia aryabhattai]|uniref:hypothetical protein n=1 Tax=Priestia aryabhattai TaxID=412384 RepID=UPI00147A5193|nr:hypothetical protein [Priestia aryabhattai]MED4153574.1 hypothetical protein [Priestia aryabhattai]
MTKTPAEKAEQMRPRRSASDEEAQRPTAESEAVHGNQLRYQKRFSSYIPFIHFRLDSFRYVSASFDDQQKNNNFSVDR